MNVRGIIITSVILFITTFQISVQGNEASKAKSILFDAIKFTEKASFKAINPTLGGESEKEKVILYRMTSPTEGVMEKYEQVIKNKKYVIILRNKKTFIWMENANTAIETTFPIIRRLAQSGHFLRLLKYYKQFKIGTYSLSQKEYKGIPCYQVTVRYPTDDATIAKLEQTTLEHLKENRDDCETRYMSVMTFLIGRDNPFIYSCVYYSMRGKAIFTMNWGELDLKTPITQKDFEFPKGTSIEVAKTRDEMKILTKKYFTPSAKGK